MPYPDLPHNKVDGTSTLTAADVEATSDAIDDLDARVTTDVANLADHVTDTSTHGVATVAGLTETQVFTNKTLTTPTIADFTNATHDHGDADDGGAIVVGALPSAIPATKIADGSVEDAEFQRLNGVTSAIQTQIDAKAPIASPTFTGTVTLPVGLTGVIRTDSGVVSVDADVTDIVAAASDTAAGKVELATTAETTTGTDATRAVTPDGLHDMTSLAGAAWFLDEDNMASDSATKVPSQQSVKAYADTKQPLDSDLTTIAGLTATTNNFMVAESSAWASRTPTQAIAHLGLDADIATLSLPASTTISAFGASLVDDAAASNARTTLELVAGGAGDIWVEKAGDTMTGDLTIEGAGAQLIVNSDIAGFMAVLSKYGNDAFGPFAEFRHSRNATLGSQTVVQSGDTLGSLRFFGSDGTNFELAAQIVASVGGTPGDNDMPGQLTFATSADGAVSPTTRLTISSTGLATFANAVAVTGDFAVNTNKFTVTASSGNTLVAGTFDSTGAATLASTLAVTGRSTLSGNTIGTTAGTGITGGSGTIYTASAIKEGSLFKTTIVIDITGLNSSVTNDVIGNNAQSNCHIGQITAAASGTIFAGSMQCLEAPATGDADIDLWRADESTLAEDTQISAATGEVQLLAAGAVWTAGTTRVLTAYPAANSYLYLTSGGAGASATYTTGIFVITLYGS